MKGDRLARVNELIRREIGEYLFRVPLGLDIDRGALTVTHVITSSDLRKARVLVSIRGHETERPRLIALLQKHHAEIQSHLAETVILKYTPRLTFTLDPSLETGDRVLQLLSDIESDTPPPESSEGSEHPES